MQGYTAKINMVIAVVMPPSKCTQKQKIAGTSKPERSWGEIQQMFLDDILTLPPKQKPIMISVCYLLHISYLYLSTAFRQVNVHCQLDQKLILGSSRIHIPLAYRAIQR